MSKEELDGMKDRVMFTYEKVPFNMLCTFKSFEFWDKDLIMACVEFKRKFDKWPTAILANDLTYEKWEESVRSQLGEPDYDDEDDFDEDELFDDDCEGNIGKEVDFGEDYEDYDEIDSDRRRKIKKDDFENKWGDFDTNIPLDEIKPEGVPIIFGGEFSTPFFHLELLVDDNFEEGMFRLMYGEDPGTDDGEVIPDDAENVA